MIVKPFEQIATQYGSSLLQKFLNGLGGGTGSTSTLGLGSGIDSSVASSTSSLYTPSVSAYNFTMNAKGGAYDSPSLSSYSGQVLTKPTFFAFASGAGVAGEAGPEGILPLARGANGSLGVKAYGGSSGGDSAPAITIIDQRTAKDSQPVQTSSGSDASGKKFIQVLVRDTVKGGMAAGEYDATMKANFQATRPLTKR
jgi:phage-related minor tail protein